MSLLDLIKAERARRAGASNHIAFLIPGWTETQAEYDARIAALRAAGEIDDRTKILPVWRWEEPPFLHEMPAWREKQRRDRGE